VANVYVLIADTYGSAAMECQDLNLTLKNFPKDNADDYKAKIVNELGKDKLIYNMKKLLQKLYFCDNLV
jgi:soluble P-type ATPase